LETVDGGEHLISQIEIKNENLPILGFNEFKILKSRHESLQVLNLSMNKISKLEGTIDLVNLKELILSDNLIKSIHPFLFSNVTKLIILDLSIN
jgi:Leucine-rich repeat (LRR) protein